MPGIFALTCLALCGCGRMDNAAIVDTYKFCKEQGMGVAVYREFGDGPTVRVECVPPENKPTGGIK